jgi:hypothetical protein
MEKCGPEMKKAERKMINTSPDTDNTSFKRDEFHQN